MQEDFEHIMAGILPDGQQLGKKQGENILHRPGFDLTFSAPKSVSILALAGGDDRLIVLHQKAVSVALGVVERLAQARVKQGDVMTYESTRNVVAAKFMHDTSREGDPQLHTHVVVANMTQRTDGTWRSLASDLSRQNGFFERVMNDHTYLGMIYRAELAKGLTEMGFELETVNKHGLFEIKGVPKEVLETFSKRRQQIEAMVKEKEFHSLEAHNKATLATRKAKTQTDRETLLTTWEEELKGKNWDPKAFIQETAEKSQEKKPETILSSLELAKTVVNDTLTILSERALSMEYGKIMQKAMEYSVGQCTHQEIVDAFEIGAKEKRFIPLDENKSQWTTEHLVKIEVALLDAVKENKNGRAAMRVKEDWLDKRDLSESDKTLVKNLLTSQDRLMVLNHASGDKHAFLTQIMNAIESQGRCVKILSPNAVHAHEVSEKVARDAPKSLWQWIKGLGKESVSDTVARFNFQVGKEVDLPIYVSSLQKGVIIVDAAQKMAPEAMKTLFEITDKLQSKVILLNDVEGKSNAFQGDVMSTLQKANIRTFTRDTENRQKPTLDITLHTVADDEERLKVVALHYATLSRDDRQKTLVVGQSTRETKQLNSEIREQLKNAGQLWRMEQTITTHQPVFLSQTERRYAKHYERDMVLRQYHKGMVEELKVHAVLHDENALWVINSAGNKQYQLCKKIPEKTQIFQEKRVALSEGEQLMVTGNMKSLGLVKGERLTVKSVSQSAIQIEKAGKIIALKPEMLERSHLDHHYAESITQLRAEKTAQLITSQKSRAIDQISIQALAKKSDQIIFYTNDPEKAERRFTALPEKTSVIDKVMEAYHESQFIKKELQPENVEKLKRDLEVALGHLTAESLKTPVEKAVDYAIAQLSERNAGFEHQELVKTAIGHALGKVTLSEVETILKQHVNEGILINGRDATGKTLWTTREALVLEKEILSEIENGKGTQKPLADSEQLRVALEKSCLNKGQREACYLIGTTTDRFAMVQGYAGTGKSTMLAGLTELIKELPKILSESGKPMEIIACAPTHQAVKELQGLGIPAQTLKSLLAEQDRDPTDFSNKIVLLDEVSMVSNKDFHEFQTMITRNNGRVIYAGDMAQYLSVESGKPIEIALKKGRISTAYMTEIVRQESQEVKGAVIDIIQGNIKEAFQKIDALPLETIPRERTPDSEKWLAIVENLKSSIVEVNPEKEEKSAKIATTHSGISQSSHVENLVNKFFSESSHDFKRNSDLLTEIAATAAEKTEGDAKRPMSVHEAVAAEYLSRPKEIRDNTVIIIQTHKDRGIVHEALFDGLIARGEIAKEGLEITRLKSKGLTRVEARHCDSYKGGEIVRIRQGDYLEVQRIDESTKSLHCLKPDGEKEIIYPERIGKRVPMEVYDKETAFLSQGMRVKFTQTDKTREIVANREWHVQEAKENRIQLQEKGSERTIILNPHKLHDCHWDHAYTTTGYGVQGSSYRYVIDMAVSYLKHSTNMRAFYISVSRAKQHIMTFTDNKIELLNKLLKNSGDKYAALEVTGELKNKVKVPDVSQDNRAKNTEVKTSENEGYKEKTPEHLINSTQKSRQTSGDESRIFSTYSEPKKPIYNAKMIEENLKNKAEFVANHILGEPNKHLSTSSKLRFGNKGSLMLNIQGDKAGTWYDFEHAKGGNMLEFLKEKLNMGFKESLEYGASLTGNSVETRKVTPQKNEKNHIQKAEKTTLETALKLVKESLPIRGTLAEKYLKNTREVQINAETNVRFLPRAYTGKGNTEKQKYAPALLSIAKDKAGKIQGIQVTYLDPKTQDKSELNIKKRTYGSPSGASVLLQSSPNKDAKTYITEGVETGLSVANASLHSNVITTLGKSNFSKIDPEILTKDVVFCLDNDGKNILQDKGIMSSIQRLSEHGKNVSIVLPDMLPKHEKTDFNDLIKQGGIEAVQAILGKEISAKKLEYAINKQAVLHQKTDENHIKNEEFFSKINDEKHVQAYLNTEKHLEKSHYNITLNIEKSGAKSIHTMEQNTKISAEKTVSIPVNKVPTTPIKGRGFEMEI